MIRVTGRGLNTDDYARHYGVAGQAMACQNEVKGLGSYATGLATRQFTDLLSSFVEAPVLAAKNADLRYSGLAPFANKMCDVRYWCSNDRGQLDIDGVPSCQIDFAESHVHVMNGQALDAGMNLELITGPALVLLLAQSRTYCLHAGAVDTPVGRIGIMAESGAGKSTLSRHVGDDWCQIVDDILPMKINADELNVDVLPNFPQLKLRNYMVESGVPAMSPLTCLLRINPAPSDDIHFSILSKSQAMLQVIRHTVAAKLFDNSVLRGHAGFAKQVSLLVPVVEVSYPRNLSQLDDLQETIVEYLTQHIFSG